MQSSVQKLFEKFLLDRLQGKESNFSDIFQNLSFKEKIALNEKFAALKKVEKVWEDLPEIRDAARKPLLEDVATLKKKNIGGCQITKRLGQGGMGVVYLARQEKLDREVAIKVLRSFAVGSPTLLARFQLESKLIAQLDHPNIVPVYDIGQEGDSFYIIMKYVEGVNLGSLVDELRSRDRSSLQMSELQDIYQRKLSAKHPISLTGKNPTEFFCNLIVKVARALEYAHGQGVIHRDIKPSNIMVRPNGEPVLLDFGLGRQEGEQSRTLSGEFLGTPVYSAPESFQQKIPDKARLLDVYSLGVTLYELLTGGLPYPGDSIYEVYSSVKNQAPVNPKSYWKELPLDLNTIVLKAIEKNPNFRYQSITEFREDLEHFLNYQPILAKRPALRHRLYYFIKRNRYKAVAAVLGPILLVSLVYGFFISRSLQKTKEQEVLYKELNDFDEIRRTEGAAILADVHRMNAEYGRRMVDWTQEGLDSGEDPREVISQLEAKLKTQPNNPNLLESLAEAYLAVSDYRRAEEVGYRLLKLDPKDFSAYVLLADAVILNGEDLEKASELVRKFNKHYPNETGGNGVLGIRCLVKGDYPCATEFLSLAAAQNPKKFIKILGLAYAGSGDYLKAIQAYEQALRFYPDDPQIYDGLAIGYGKLDRFKEALQYAEKAVQIESENEPRQRLVRSLQAHLAQQKSFQSSE